MRMNTNLISCNFPPINLHHLHHKTPSLHSSSSSIHSTKLSNSLKLHHNHNHSVVSALYDKNHKKGTPQFCVSSSVSDDPLVEKLEEDEDDDDDDDNVGDFAVENDGNGDGGGDWNTSVLLFVFWGAIMFYVFNLAPNQTPTTDLYFVRKLSNLVGDDGFRMNQVLVSLWYIMGLWPIVYSMLLLPSARSSKTSVPVWPFAVLSFFGGAYALIPYFILWRPPPPPIKEEEVHKWPLNFLESKITAGLVCAAGVGLVVYAGLGYDDWKEFYLYFRSSKLVHATSLDFSLLSAFAPFWVYNDMTARKCYDKTAWLLPLSIVPFLGPALYVLLRPPLTTLPVSLESTLKSE